MALTSFLEWKNIQEASLPPEKTVHAHNVPSEFGYSDVDSAVQEANKLEPKFKNILTDALRKGAMNNGYVVTNIKLPESIQRKIATKKKSNPQFNALCGLFCNLSYFWNRIFNCEFNS